MPGQPDFERMQKMSPEEKMQYFQQLAEEQRKAAEEQEAIAMQQALGADEKQWNVIEPRLKKVKRYRELAFIGSNRPVTGELVPCCCQAPVFSGKSSPRNIFLDSAI